MAWVAEFVPEHCPRCGSPLPAPDGGRIDCRECDTRLYDNPLPMGRATVVDGDGVLLVEMGHGPDEGAWVLAGGRLEAGEHPRTGAARELREETGLAVDPDDLALLGTGVVRLDGGSLASINFAAPRSAAEGPLSVGEEPHDARFWTRAEIERERPLLRASGVDQVLAAIDRFGE